MPVYNINGVVSNPYDLTGTLLTQCYKKNGTPLIGPLQGKKLSILGDSISTYAGYIPSGNANYYTGSNCGVTSVTQTWWYRSLHALGAALLVNNSWSGSRVSATNGNESAGCMTRCQELGSAPDVIIVYMGINDFNNEVDLGDFDGTGTPSDTLTFSSSYGVMLNKIKAAYPQADVFCCTLPVCERNGATGDPEINDAGVPLLDFNRAITTIAYAMGVKVLDFANCGITYANLSTYMGDWESATGNALHPNSAGHALIANKCIADIVKSQGGADYYESDTLAKTDVTLTELGSLKYSQSYCIYNGRYYSTDGSNIAEQNAGFTVLRDVAINLGHGNGLQLGSNGKAYASGWDDQTVYVVDLATLTVTRTITLPTEGYTTCVVDDVNGLVYIWQRPTRPNTESVYNFIVYDYINEEIVSTKETAVAFGAMQAADWYGDNFIVLNGLGTVALPNGYRIYNKAGDIIGEYVIGTQSAVEPEGVFADRETGELTMSYSTKKIYRIN